MVLSAANYSISREAAALLLNGIRERGGAAGGGGGGNRGGGGGGDAAVAASPSNVVGMLAMAQLLGSTVSFVEFQQVMAKVLQDERIGSIFRIHASEARRLAKTTGRPALNARDGPMRPSRSPARPLMLIGLGPYVLHARQAAGG